MSVVIRSLGMTVLRTQVLPPSWETKIGAAPCWTGVNADAAMSCGFDGLTVRFGSLSLFVSWLMDCGMIFTSLTLVGGIWILLSSPRCPFRKSCTSIEPPGRRGAVSHLGTALEGVNRALWEEGRSMLRPYTVPTVTGGVFMKQTSSRRKWNAIRGVLYRGVR